MLAPGAPLAVFDEIDSTMLEARRRADFGDLGPAWLLARLQTAGRGRRGRAWTTIPGNLMATYFGATPAPPAAIALLGFAAGIAIAEALDDAAGAPCATLKWPNDVLLDGRKAAGVLLDSGAAGAGVTWFALGFGVNLTGAPGDAGYPTAALAQRLPPGVAAPAPEAFLDAVRGRLEPLAGALERDGFAAVRAAWLARAHGLGAHASAQIGETRIEGIARGLSPRGELELETPQGLRLIAAGDVHFPPAES
jgi:BirA family biotin operon repressor/biotin-[acetyl-CoA-carboxylase] ligase